jgi:hypothetical protein
VSDFRFPDPRIAYALALLRDCLDGDAAGGSPLASSGSPEGDWLQSSTDILTPWYPNAANSGPGGWVTATPSVGAWDTYFANVPLSFRDGGNGAVRGGLLDGGSRWPDRGDAGPTAVLGGVDLPWAANGADLAVAEAVIESLYGFLHAIGRADVPAAMRWVAADYHAMEGDREITHDVLRQQIEDVVDARRDSGLEVSLAQVPEPIAHPLGVLVKLTIQIDSRNAVGLPESLLLYRVAIFQQRDGRWWLASLGTVNPVP